MVDLRHAPAGSFVWHADVCTGKVHYTDKVSAKHGARRCKREYGLMLKPYRCPICCGWHLRTVR